MTWRAGFIGALLACAMALQFTAARAADVRAWLDRDAIQLGETVTLNVESSGAATLQPDFAPLQKDFTLLGTQSSRQVTVSNGVRTAKTLWAVGLEPKRAGTFTLAPIAVGSARTEALQLTVAPAPAGAPLAGGNVFLEVEAEPATPYVQQQVRYTARLYYAFDLTDGNLSEPRADGLAVQRLGQDKSYLATVGGRRYHVVERHYAVTPERSGGITIPALAFRGNALDVTDPTGFFSRGRPVSARSQAVTLQVRPQPAGWQGPWLPATSLLLEDEGDLPDQVHVGDPVTRTIRLQAQGLGYEQLPELELAAPAGADMYPDKADTRTRDDGTWLFGERVRKFAFVPNRPGTLVIPGTSVQWWDVANNRARTPRLAPHTIRVLPATGAPAAASPQASTSGAAAPPAVPASGRSPSLPVPPLALPRDWPWPAIAGGLFILWLLTLAAWWQFRRTGVAVAPALPDTRASAPRAAFQRACALGDLAAAERALVAWARAERPQVHNLGELAAASDDPAQRDALEELQKVRYAGAAGGDLATRLQRAFRNGIAWRPTDSTGPGAGPLPPLWSNHP
jgi:hypothetical protein